VKALIIVLLLLSLFVGIPINGDWNLLYVYEFPAVLGMIARGTFGSVNLILWILLIISQLLILSSVFPLRSAYVKNILIFAPLMVLICYFFLNFIMLVCLIPFVIVWGIILFNLKKTTVAKRN